MADNRVQNAADVRKYLNQRLPKNLMPTNVGGVSKVGWNFTYPVNITLNSVLNGANWEYTLGPSLRQTVSFQINADAGFLLTAISFAGGPAYCDFRQQPIMVTIRDAQSSREFMNSAMPLNNFGNPWAPLILEKPFYMEPRAMIEIILTTFEPTTVTRTLATTLTNPQQPKAQLIFHGVRTRAEDARRMLGSAIASGDPLDGDFAPGNIGDINDVIWPFWFTFDSRNIGANQSFQSSVTVTQEAAFIWRYSMLSVYEPGADGAAILASGPSLPNALFKVLRDPQSTRVFHDLPETLYGYDPNFPYFMAAPMLLMPNSAMQLNLSYDGGLASQYRPIHSIFGYRVRIPGGENIASLVTG